MQPYANKEPLFVYRKYLTSSVWAVSKTDQSYLALFIQWQAVFCVWMYLERKMASAGLPRHPNIICNFLEENQIVTTNFMYLLIFSFYFSKFNKVKTLTYKWISFILSTNCQPTHHIDWDIIGSDGHIHASKSNQIRHFNIQDVMQTMNSGMPWCFPIGHCLRRELFSAFEHSLYVMRIWSYL